MHPPKDSSPLSPGLYSENQKQKEEKKDKESDKTKTR